MRTDIKGNNLAAEAGDTSAAVDRSILASGRAQAAPHGHTDGQREVGREHPKAPWDSFLLLQRACGYISRIQARVGLGLSKKKKSLAASETNRTRKKKKKTPPRQTGCGLRRSSSTSPAPPFRHRASAGPHLGQEVSLFLRQLLPFLRGGGACLRLQCSSRGRCVLPTPGAAAATLSWLLESENGDHGRGAGEGRGRGRVGGVLISCLPYSFDHIGDASGGRGRT